jgi:hypothetical protein
LAIDSDFAALCARLGADPWYTQGAGGNASEKKGGVLTVKASGRPMILQALDDLPPGEEARVVLRRDMPGAAEIAAVLPAGATPVWLDSPTDGQARTVALALKPGDAERRLASRRRRDRSPPLSARP